MNKSFFTILTPHAGGTLAEQTESIASQWGALLSDGTGQLASLFQARLYLSDAVNQWPLLQSVRWVKQLSEMGALNYVEQPPLGGAKVALWLWFIGGEVKRRQVTPLSDGCLTEVEAGGLTYLWQSVRFEGENATGDEAEQTRRAFSSHIAQLRQRGLTLRDHCQRTWFYVRDVDCHYAGMVGARNEVFAAEGLTADTHYIASTGIGGASADCHAWVAADFLSVAGLDASRVGYLQALDYLNPTREYGVAFERGTYLDLPEGRLFLISGTASIDKHGDCLFRGDVLTQAGRLFLNIEKLLQSAGGSLAQVRYFIVYLRDVADYHAVHTYMKLRFPHVPFLITEARVCRPEWLMEVECMAE